MKTFLPLSFFLSMVGLSFAEDLNLPKPAGVYSVGTKAIEISDPSRRMFRDSNPRRWMIQAFYPSEKHQGTYSYMPGTLEDGIVGGQKVLSYAKPDGRTLSLKCPVIIFVPGLGGERQKYTILLEELASQGYIVFSLDVPYLSNFVKFPDGTKFVLTYKDAWKIPRDRDYRYQYYDEAMAGVIEDIQYMLTHLSEINLKHFGNIDADNLILMGHSFGGNVAHTLGFKEGRIKAIVDIDSKITERKIFGQIGVLPNANLKPVLFIRGMMQYQEDVGDQLKKIANATLWSPYVQHSAFSDQAYFSALIQDFGKQRLFYEFFRFLFKQGPFFSNIDTSLGRKEVNFWFREYRKFIVSWLNHHTL